MVLGYKQASCSKFRMVSLLVAGHLTSVQVQRNGLVMGAKVFAQFAECTERELP
jgi:hypothetical protein